MLRLYDPIEDKIFKLHALIEHLVCDVWCQACDDSCEDKLNDEFKAIYNYSIKTGVTLQSEVERIYEIFKTLTHTERQLIKEAFITTNAVEHLCNGKIPISLNQLNDVVCNDIQPILKWSYESLLGKKKVSGNKMMYYRLLIKHNGFKTCPCCGLIDFESFESKYREAYDHYLPKSKYPFASVNFQNLVPLCYKCNSDRKRAKDPIENGRVVFYPFSKEKHSIDIKSSFSLSYSDITLEVELNDFKLLFSGHNAKIETWLWLFDINERYEHQIKGFAKTFLKRIKRRHNHNVKLNLNWTLLMTIDELIKDYEHDYYEDKKFLKIAFLKMLRKEKPYLQSCA